MKTHKLLILSALSLLSAQIILAQTHRSTFRTNDATIELEEEANTSVVYLFSDFMPAVIYYPGEYAQMNINYRLLMDEIIALDERGETKALTTREKFDSIVVNNDMRLVFHNRFGYLEKPPARNKRFFIKHQSTYTMNEIVPGAYGQASPTSSAQSVNVLAGRENFSVASRGERLRLENTTGNEVQVNIVARPTLGLIINNDFNIINSRRDLNRLFPDHRSEIRSFLRSERISFDERLDLLKLVEFLDGL